MLSSMRKLFFIVHLCVVLGDCQLIRAPSNTALIVGQRLELICQPDISYTVREWISLSPSSSNMNKIYTGWSSPRIVGSQRFGYIKDNNAIILYLNSTELDDAGTYDCSCQLETKQLDHYSAQLIVLETEPVCEDSMTTVSNDTSTLEGGSIVWMRCSVNFRGNLVPTIEWRQRGGNRDMDSPLLTDMVETMVIPDGNISMISSTLTIAVNLTYNATFFTCKTYFQWDNTSSPNTTATNAPDYSHTWNSSTIIVSATTFVQIETTTVSASTSVNTSTENGSWLTVNAIYLVAGVAVLFGIASSLVALIMCLRLRRKNSAAMADLNGTEPLQSEYDLIPYAITDGYDTIEEVDEKDDILFHNLPPRLGPLPTPDYSGLEPAVNKPPGVYSRMEHKKPSADDEEIGVDGEKHHLNEYLSAPDASKLSDEKDLGRTPMLPPNDYLDLRTSVAKDIVDDSDEIPSAYLKISDAPSQSTNSDDKEIVPGEHSSRMPALGTNQYLALSAEVDKDSADENKEMSSTYLTVRDDSSQANNANKNTKETITEGEMSSTYLTTRDMDSSK